MYRRFKYASPMAFRRRPSLSISKQASVILSTLMNTWPVTKINKNILWATSVYHNKHNWLEVNLLHSYFVLRYRQTLSQPRARNKGVHLLLRCFLELLMYCAIVKLYHNLELGFKNVNSVWRTWHYVNNKITRLAWW